ncbi:MAG: sensor histidine kinase, partial [Candidatus Sericytochromatia bacterium]
TPINAIMGFGSILDDELAGPLNPAQRHYSGRILTSAEALLALINDLLDMSRIQAGKFSIEQAAVSLPEVTQEVVSTLQENA